MLECIVGNVTNAPEGIVSVLSGTRHGLTNDDFVTFSYDAHVTSHLELIIYPREVEGMKELNGTTHRVKFVDANSFKVF